MVSKSEEYNQEDLPDGDLEDRDYDPKEHDFISHLVAAKARVTPLKTGLTIPRSELSGLLLCMRLLSRSVSLYSGGFGSVSCLEDCRFYLYHILTGQKRHEFQPVHACMAE